MAVAYFMVHAPRGFFPLLNGGELAIVYCFVFLYLWVAGGGEWSLDRLRAPASAFRPIAEPGLIIRRLRQPWIGPGCWAWPATLPRFNLPARVGQLFGVSL